MQSNVNIRLSVMMFLQFFIWGAWYVTVGNYMKAHGMFDQVFWAYTVGPIAALISPFFLGMVADRFFSTERVLAAMQFLGAAAMLCVPFAAGISTELFIIVLLVHMLCYMPTLGLTNTLAFHHIEDQEKQFPVIRVFGTVGWIVANFVVSRLLKADFTEMQFYVTSAAAFGLAVYSLTLPHTPPPAKGQEFSIREILGLDALALMKQRSFAVFLISSFLICIPLAAYYTYAPIFAGKVGYEQPASWMLWGQVSEIVFMLLMPFFFTRLGVKWMLLIGMLAWVVRYGLFAGADSADVMWMVFIGILLHGICYDFFFVTGFIYTDKKSTQGIRGQAQGLLVLVTQGLGLGIGAPLMGWIVAANTPPEAVELNAKSAQLSKDAFATADASQAEQLQQQAGKLAHKASTYMDWQTIWLMPCIAAAVVMVAFGLLFYDRVRDEDVSEEDVAEAAAREEQP